MKSERKRQREEERRGRKRVEGYGTLSCLGRNLFLTIISQ